MPLQKMNYMLTNKFSEVMESRSSGALVQSYQQHAKVEQTYFSIPPSPNSVTESTAPSRNPDPLLFKELLSIRPSGKRIYQLVDQTSTPIYTIIERDKTFQAQKPDIQLYSGADKTCPLVGVVKLYHMHAHEFVVGIGDPNATADDGLGKEMIWESLRRGEKWRHISHTFEFGIGAERRAYTWRRTVKYWSNYVKDMELRVGGLEEKQGELVALWTGTSWHNLKKGTLFFKERGADKEELRKWGIVVVLTAMAIIENAVRRAR